MLMLGGVLTGCGGGNKVATGGEGPNVVPEDTYEINWYMQGMPQEDVASVEAAVNDYLKDKINANTENAQTGIKSVQQAAKHNDSGG